MDGYRTWLDRAWDRAGGRLPVLLVPMLGTTAMLDVVGRSPVYVGAAASGVAVWVFLLWRRPLSRQRR